MVLGADGVVLRVHDSPENREEFHLPGSARRSAGYPQIRGVGVLDLRSRKLVDFDFADCKTGELTLAGPLLEKVPDHSVTVVDRLYVAYNLLHGIHSGGEQRHWLLRARKNLKWKVIRQFGILIPGGRLDIRTGFAAPYKEIVRGFEAAGFIKIVVRQNGDITAWTDSK